MRLKQLEENVRYGQKEKDLVMKSLNDFKFGFEIEMNPGDGTIDEDTTFEEYLSERDLDVTITSSESGDLAAILVDFIIDSELYDLMYNDSEKFKVFNNDTISLFNFGDDLTGDMFPFELHYTIIQTIIDELKEIDYVDVDDMQETLSDWNGLTTKHWKYVLLALMNEADVDTHDIKENDLLQLSSAYGRFIDHLTSLLSELDMSDFVDDSELIAISDMDTEMRNEFNSFYNSELRNHIDRITEISKEIRDNPAYSPEIKFSNIHSDDIAKAIESEIDDLFGNHGLSLKEVLTNFDLEDRYSEILSELIHHGDLSSTDEHEQYQSAIEGGDHGSVFGELSNTNNVDYKVEHDGQIEIITTKPVGGNAIIDHYEQMKDLIAELKEHGYYTDSNSGLHMSISYKNGSTGMNFNKFSVLSDMYRITENDGNAIRQYVNDVFRYVNDSELDILDIIIQNIESNQNPISEIVNAVEKGLRKVRSNEGHELPKYHGINFADYGSNGRVELRFFGGSEYDDRLNEYFETLIKFMYILKIASDDSHDVNYYKALVKITNKVFSKRFGMTVDEATRNAKVNMGLITKNLGLKHYKDIDSVYDEIENMVLQSKNPKIREALANLLEMIEDDNFEQMLIQPETTVALKIFAKHKNTKSK